MEILFNKKLNLHNTNSTSEGSYRTKKLEQTVNDNEINNLMLVAEKYLKSVHLSNYIRKIRRSCKVKGSMAETELTPESYKAMLTSVCLSIKAAKEGGFAITRPPGHHAFSNKAGGFCFFNNIAIATSYLLDQGKKVCIIDIDGHHGNGTQSMFRKNKSVLYCSIHEKDAYPNSGFVTDIEKTKFKNIINIPLLKTSGDDLFIKSLEFFKYPIKEFNPDNIAISAGFDGYSKDKLLNLNYSKRGYYEAGKFILSLNKPFFAVLEGGYHEDLKECIDNFIWGATKKEIKFEESLTKSDEKCSDNLSKNFVYYQNFWRNKKNSLVL
jgi:acetoin utilization deacetylase AcuC-like enzyme